MTLGEPVLPDAVEGAAAAVDAVEVSWALLLLGVSAGVSGLLTLLVGVGIGAGCSVGLAGVSGAALVMSDTTFAIITWPDSSEVGNSANSRCTTHSKPACISSTAAMVLRSRALEMWCG